MTQPNIAPTTQAPWSGPISDGMSRLASQVVNPGPHLKVPGTKEKNALDAVFWRFVRALPWHAGALAGVRRILTYDPIIPTAAVGWAVGQPTLVINCRWFFEELGKHQLGLMLQYFTLAHEVEHLVRKHIQICKNWPALRKRINFTADALINQSLIQESTNPFTDQHMPAKGIDFKRFLEEISDQPSDPKLRGKKWPKGVGEHDFTHNFTAEELLPFLPKKSDDPGAGGKSGVSKIEDLMDGITGPAGEFFDDESVPEQMKDAMVDNIIKEAEKVAGSTPGYLQPYIDKIRDKTNREWRRLLRGVGYSTRVDIWRSRSHYNKRCPVIKSGKYIFTRPPVLLVVDRSGSCSSDQDTINFCMEMNALTSQCDMDVIYVDADWDETNPDTYVRGISEMKPWKHFKDMGGGTNFDNVYDFLLQGDGVGRYETVILMTDGFLFTNPRIPARLARHNVAILTPHYCTVFHAEAKALGFKIAIIDDAAKRKNKDLRGVA